MASDVYFANLRARSVEENKSAKIRKLFDRAGFGDLITEGGLTAVKIHFGESGSDGFINPVFVRQVVDKIKEHEGKPFLTDSNGVYSGTRHNAVDHLETAILHGFAYAVAGAPVVIADGIFGENAKNVEINLKHFQTAKIAGSIVRADSMIVLTHFKGHMMAGFGGAIKNLAMGCATAAGKREQHVMRFEVDREKCEGCGDCVEACPQQAVFLKEEKSTITRENCIGCGECATVCPAKAITPVFGDGDVLGFTERLAEYALAAVKDKHGRVGYINFVLNVTPDCDCVPWTDAPIVPDIGILAAKDPVAIDRAALDLINKAPAVNNTLWGESCQQHDGASDKFKAIWKNSHGEHQLSYGESIGLGSREYRLIEI
ncbi:MAG: DUF362 domain-containing protein [Thermacetogeniaceae bacterium]|jgi:uncharacterized Fe-S center protein